MLRLAVRTADSASVGDGAAPAPADEDAEDAEDDEVADEPVEPEDGGKPARGGSVEPPPPGGRGRSDRRSNSPLGGAGDRGAPVVEGGDGGGGVSPSRARPLAGVVLVGWRGIIGCASGVLRAWDGGQAGVRRQRPASARRGCA
jgi:hypothetical protein